MTLKKRRKMDYYIKGLSLKVRKELFKKIDNLNPTSVGRLLDKPDGYPSFKRLSYSEEEIYSYFRRLKVGFDDINAFMMAHGRCPLFSNTEDSYQSAMEYKKLMELKPALELEEEFGCSFQDYVPPVYTADESN